MHFLTYDAASFKSLVQSLTGKLVEATSRGLLFPVLMVVAPPLVGHEDIAFPMLA
jgi:hypothetical protein